MPARLYESPRNSRGVFLGAQKASANDLSLVNPDRIDKKEITRSVAQPGRALAFGARGRWFKSTHTDKDVSTNRSLCPRYESFSYRQIWRSEKCSGFVNDDIPESHSLLRYPDFIIEVGEFSFLMIEWYSMNNFWKQLPQPFFVLAPMEAVTDVIFRHVVAQAGAPDVWFSEFTNATGWVHAGQKAIGGRLIKTEDEQPIVAQIWGGEPGDMEQLATYCHDIGFHGIDINMGCPAKSAIKSGGSALIRKPDIAVAAIKAAKITGLPVSVKTRLGYTSVDEWRNWLTILLQQDIANLTVHLRTKKEMSKVPAHFELIPEIIKLRDKVAPQTLLTINGDIRDRVHGEELVAQYPGINGVMIGRGIFHNPFAFVDSLSTASEKDELIKLLQYHLDLYDQYCEQTARPFETLKRFFKIYIRTFDGAKELRDKLMHTKSTDEVRALLATL